MTSSTPPPDGLPAALGVELAVDLDTVFVDLQARVEDLRSQQRRAVHEAAERAIGWPTSDDVDAYLAAKGDRDRLRGKYLVTVHLAYLADLEVDGLIANARRYGATWQDVAAATGTTRQVAHGRWRHLDPIAQELIGLPGPDLDPLVPLDGGADLTEAERLAGGRLLVDEGRV